MNEFIRYIYMLARVILDEKGIVTVIDPLWLVIVYGAKKPESNQIEQRKEVGC
jgi:hypothetical protein